MIIFYKIIIIFLSFFYQTLLQGHFVEKEGFSIRCQSTKFFKGMTTMKKLTTLLLAAGMVFAASAPASAVDVKMDGEYMFSFGLGERLASGSNFDFAGQRLRLGMTFTANENLSGYVQFQAGIGDDTATYDWGTDITGRDSAVSVRQAYIDWMVPNTDVKVRMGKQFTGLPVDASGKNAIMMPTWGGRDGVTISGPVTDWLGLTAFWVRGAYKANGEFHDTSLSEKSDYFALIADMKFDGFAVSPYVMYAALDKNADVDSSTDASIGAVDADGNAFWAGVTSTMTYFDPFVLKLSGAYGVASYDSEYNLNDRAGWYVQAKGAYKTAYGTPTLLAWYGSGDDRDVKYGRQDWIPTNNGRFHPTLGSYGLQYGLCNGLANQHNIAGTWGIQAGIEDVSFLQDLSHKFTVTLFKGTNHDTTFALDQDPYKYMTYSDTAVEFNLASTYNIYKNLTANLELAYVIADYDKDDHFTYADGDDYSENGWSAVLSFAYKF